MTILKTTLFLTLAMALSFCAGSKNNKATTDNSSQPTISEEQMIEQGYLKGTIRFSETEGDCPYVIEVDSADYNYMLDPVNLESDFMTDGVKIWFKFAGLRRPNRCEKASPVNLIEIQRRK